MFSDGDITTYAEDPYQHNWDETRLPHTGNKTRIERFNAFQNAVV
jgi:hypothetical protein